MQWLIIPAAAGLCIFLYQLLRSLFGREAPMERLGQFVNPVENTTDAAKPRKQEYRQGIGVLARGIARSGMFGNYRLNLRKTLVRANILMKPEEFIAFQVIALVVGFFIGLLATGAGPVPLITAIIGLSIPSVFVRKRIKNRLKLINTQLGDTIAIQIGRAHV